MAEPKAFAIDTFAVFGGYLLLRGWAVDTVPITSVQLRIGQRHVAVTSYGKIDSNDVVDVIGAIAQASRFEEVIPFDPAADDITAAELILTCRNGQQRVVTHLGFPRGQPAIALPETFKSMLNSDPRKGTLLEVGSRARSGVVRRDLIPDQWSYVGLDIMDGPNVDVVGDAHQLSSVFPTQKFDAVMAFSVIEHLMMPWKFVVELNRILRHGAIGIVTTHQAWPLHDSPWDFWRFSDRSWAALFNAATGFEVLQAHMGEPAYFVAQRCHNVTNFGMDNIGYLASNVIFRKVGETDLEWPVLVHDLTPTTYPAA